MHIYTEHVDIPRSGLNLEALGDSFSTGRYPVRFVVTGSAGDTCRCEIDCLSEPPSHIDSWPDIFACTRRRSENADRFNAVLLIPTGIGAEIGGHCGDGNAVARLVAGACDTLITHPNVVNAADMNEMTENTLYVEGSIISRLLLGQVGLRKARSNRLLLLMDRHGDGAFNNAIVNMVSTARVTLGLECDVQQMDDIMTCKSFYAQSGKASGEIGHVEKLMAVIGRWRDRYDAVGLTTHIDVPGEMEENYYLLPDLVNPWGGIEAMLTHSLSLSFDMPFAHSPMSISLEFSNNLFATIGIVEPRKASESFSRTYLYSILKGLHRAPRVVPPDGGLTVSDVSCLIIPDGCIGLPTLAAIEQDIPVLAVRGNRNLMRNDLSRLPFRTGKLIFVENYLEAVGAMIALKTGVSPAAVKRPLDSTTILTTTG